MQQNQKNRLAVLQFGAYRLVQPAKLIVRMDALELSELFRR